MTIEEEQSADIVRLEAEIERLRAENKALRAAIRENDQHFMRVDKERMKLRADVEDTKALLPNKHEADVPLRPTEHHDWWCVSIMERRKRIAAEKENEKLRAALAAVCQGVISERESIDCAVIEGAALRAAAAALKETGEHAED